MEATEETQQLQRTAAIAIEKALETENFDHFTELSKTELQIALAIVLGNHFAFKASLQMFKGE